MNSNRGSVGKKSRAQAWTPALSPFERSRGNRMVESELEDSRVIRPTCKAPIIGPTNNIKGVIHRASPFNHGSSGTCMRKPFCDEVPYKVERP